MRESLVVKFWFKRLTLFLGSFSDALLETSDRFSSFLMDDKARQVRSTRQMSRASGHAAKSDVSPLASRHCAL